MAKGSVINLRLTISGNTLKATWGCPLRNVGGYKVVFSANNGKNTFNLSKTLTTTKKSRTFKIGSHGALLWAKVTVTPKKKKKAKWTPKAVSAKLFLQNTIAPATPSAPTLEIINDKLVVYCDNQGGIEEVCKFELYEGATGSTVKASTEAISFGSDRRASYTFSSGISAGKSYRARVYYGNKYNIGTKKSTKTSIKTAYKWSAPSGYSSVVILKPPTPDVNKIKTEILKDQGVEKVKISWDTVVGADSGYDIECVSSTSLFIGEPTYSVSENTGSTIVEPPSIGTKFYIRIRAKNSSGNSDWTAENKKNVYPSFVVASKPSPPTTWSFSNKIINDEGTITNLYFTHNAIDGSNLTNARIVLTINGVEQSPITKSQSPNLFGQTTTDTGSEEEIIIYFFKLNSSSYADNTEIKWKVATKGAHDSFSDYSTERIIHVYEKPTLDITAEDLAIELPYEITLESSPPSQTPIVYSLSITSDSTYETSDYDGNVRIISDGEEIYKNTFITSENPLVVSIGPKESLFMDKQTYTMHAVVSMNSGLDAESSKEFGIKWKEEEFSPDANITLNELYSAAIIYPVSTDSSFITAEEYVRCEEGHPTQIEYEVDPGRSHYYIYEPDNNQYKQCDIYMDYDPLVQYYEIGFDESVFNSNKTHYYIYDNELDLYVQCTQETIFDPDVTYYIPIKFLDEMKLQFETNRDYYYIYENGEYVRCTLASEYDPTVIYYEPITYVEISITEEDYNLSPQNYYIFDGVNYVQCESGDAYNPEETYYIPETFRDAKRFFFESNKTWFYEYDSTTEEYTQILPSATYSSSKIYFKPPVNNDNSLSENVELSVYRREYDGQMVEIATGLTNNGNIGVLDLHPSLNYLRYRIVAISNSTGKVEYSDIEEEGFEDRPVILQWDEAETRFFSEIDVEDYDDSEDPLIASMTILKLPYNIDVSESNTKDVALQEYIGRSNPVSYYGTQLGIQGSWNVDIEKSDLDTLYKLRKLAIYPGNVYVREPSGIGYWADVSVTMSQKHRELVIPVGISITRVEGDKA